MRTEDFHHHRGGRFPFDCQLAEHAGKVEVVMSHHRQRASLVFVKRGIKWSRHVVILRCDSYRLNLEVQGQTSGSVSVTDVNPGRPGAVVIKTHNCIVLV